nr:uncharacterized protein LOC117977895 isoform X2 [Pan paniscus]
MEKGNLGPGVRIQCNSGFLLSFHELPIPTGCLEELLKAAECPAAGHFQSRGRPSKRGDGWESADILCEATIWSWTRVHVTLCHSGNLDYHTNESIQMLASGAESQDRRRSETTVNWTALGSTDEEIQHRFVLQCLAAFSARLATPETPGGQRQACHLHHCITTTQHYRGTCPDNQSLTLLSRLECSGMIMDRCNFCLLGSSDFHASASQNAGITDTHNNAWLSFVFLVEMGFHHVGLAGLELLT